MNSSYDLSKLTEEEKEQLKDYVNAIKETKKAARELLEKAASHSTKEEGKLGGPRKNMVMQLKENPMYRSYDYTKLEQEMKAIRAKYPNAKVSYYFSNTNDGKDYVIVAREGGKIVYSTLKK
ncbi:MAG: hypothetical protein EBZ49_11560 [Proteobacteria bacterium]|nr:hypothetical protein [Pseudomonadota bacterium]